MTMKKILKIMKKNKNDDDVIAVEDGNVSDI
jgi:hypothetical protein